MTSLAWMDDGLCLQVGGEAFVGDPGFNAAPAKRVCRRCPVRVECLEYALAIGVNDGVWGAMTTRERHRVLARRAAQAVAA